MTSRPQPASSACSPPAFLVRSISSRSPPLSVQKTRPTSPISAISWRAMTSSRPVFPSLPFKIGAHFPSYSRKLVAPMASRIFASKTLFAAALAVLPCMRPAFAQRPSADGGVQTFNYLADQYFSDVYFHFSPTVGTANGLHQYDTQLEDYSAANIQKQIAALHAYEKKVEAIDPAALDVSVAGDRAILLNNIRSILPTLEVFRPWEKNPDNSPSGITNSAFVIMERPYAPADTRLKALIEREKQMPQVLLEA